MPDGKDSSPSKPKPKGRKLSDMVNDLIERADELTAFEEFETWMLERVYRMREQLTQPVAAYLREAKVRPKDADLIEALGKAVEDYVVLYVNDPAGRAGRKQKVEHLKLQARRRVLGEKDRAGEIEKLVDDVRQWQWKTSLDENGRIVFATGSGAAVPGRGDIIREVGPQVIEQAIKGQRPYADEVRPRDIRGGPGGLLVLKGVRSLLVVGDLHGRYDNLETILRDRNNLKRVIDGEAHLVFTGDAVHPRSSQLNSDEAYEDSFCVMLLIMTLKAENPFNVHYMLGNHDNAHVGGRPVGRGDVQQDAVFERVLSRRFAPSVVERYREFVRNSPAAVRAEAADGSILLTHANVSPLVLNDQGLVNIFMQGRRAKALNDLLWLRDFDPGRVARDAARVGARLVVVGHTVPAAVNVSRYGFEPVHPPAFGRAGKTLLIVNAQCDVFGYLDVDLRQPLPADVVDLKAADGQPAMRVLAPKGARLDDDGR